MGAQSVSWATLCDVVGREAAHALCAVFGGVDVYVPADPARGDLPRIIGPEAMRDLAAYFGGNTIVLPNEVKKQRPVKADVIRMLQAGMSPREAAMRSGVTLAWAKRLKTKVCTPQRHLALPLA